MRFYCIADEDTVRGFRLAGVSGDVAISPSELAAAVEKAAAMPAFGVIILTEEGAARIRPLVDRIRLERDRPLIVEIPGPGGPLPQRRGLRQLVQGAVGISLELKAL